MAKYLSVLNGAWIDSVSHDDHDFRSLLNQINGHLATLYNQSGTTSAAVTAVAATASTSSGSTSGGGGSSSSVTFSGDLSGGSTGPQAVIGWEGILLDNATMAAPSNGDVPTFDSTSNTWKAASSSSGPSFADEEVPTGLINSSNVTYTLANTPSPSASLLLFLNGILQHQGAGFDYTISTNTITMATAPTTGDVLLAWYRY